MNDLQKIEDRVRREVELKNYKGEDRVVLAEEKWQQIQLENKDKPPFSVSMGLPKIDECLKTLGRGRLVVLSGPPKNGKTQLCQTFTKRFTEQGKRILWFSYEVGYEELFGKFPMTNLDFYVPNYMETGNIDWIEDKIIEAKQKHDTSIIFIDHLDFLRDSDALRNIGLNLSAYVGGIVQKIKRISVEQNVLIFLMTHIRKNNWTSNKLPSAEELRDSGQIAQLADVVMMIVRKRNKQSDPEEIYQGTEAIIGVIENRLNGKTKIVGVEFLNGEFSEITTVYNNEPQGNNKESDEEWNDEVVPFL
jgi:replicative DNA helicase